MSLVSRRWPLRQALRVRVTKGLRRTRLSAQQWTLSLRLLDIVVFDQQFPSAFSVYYPHPPENVTATHALDAPPGHVRIEGMEIVVRLIVIPVVHNDGVVICLSRDGEILQRGNASRYGLR